MRLRTAAIGLVVLLGCRPQIPQMYHASGAVRSITQTASSYTVELSSGETFWRAPYDCTERSSGRQRACEAHRQELFSEELTMLQQGAHVSLIYIRKDGKNVFVTALPSDYRAR